MDPLRRLATALEGLNAAIGRLVCWFALLMVLVGAYNALARYLGKHVQASLSSNAYIELQWYLFSALFLLGAADTLRKDAHVRVDVLYGRLSPRGQAVIDLAGTLLFLVPFCIFAIVMSWPTVESSWAVREISPDPGGLPRYPIKTLIPVCFGLVLLQGLALCVRLIDRLRGSESEVSVGG